MTTADLHTLTGAYALHALSDEEREAFERHLAECEPCAQETAELSATAARLGLAVSVPPRPAMREDVLRQIATVRQEGPTVRQEGPAGPALPRRARTRSRGSRTRPVPRWALAACLAAAAALGGTAVWQHERAEDALEQARRADRGADDIAAVLTAPDARSRTAKLAGGATGTVVVSDSRDRAVFMASGMAEPPRGKVYQLWFDDDGTMRSAGLMDPARTSQAVLMRGAVGGASGMGVTVEPKGGSEEPTSTPLALLNLPA
ncbi:anti-sigma factor [Streptomyces sp. LRE541]|uniref:anti-sigma factor n=1 Tax=Streptomyces sp. LRE541 TaxID=2931983 RepID=UPI00200C27C3|nr:anti-sigma factor [Streptomyces sp. LRE541]UPZ26894.1 anti-sigma factor [Streptomyces sp. LRE541]